ncbi:hypothetical protein EG359_02365 [Chryseobacterium joostei]|uniref:Uncharacterized protein n=1 Tax=Chryseobacterium joostei TaxID=112234 RepID=A0A1N7ILT3_9FLAO|nr:hypothetical protein [Chryseobacterium joostei]AZA98519.1 hypothetical protein EG359_02365 [Chryseobacterium joostei]SIS38048.1 hypothetical protein SAMN05421768_10652 [Chryseobacterium joostei]
MKSKIRRHILKALSTEIVGALALFVFFYTLFFNLKETIEIFKWCGTSIVFGCNASFGLAWFVPNWLSAFRPFKKYFGVIIIFGLLIVGIIAATLFLGFSDNADINGISSIFSIILFFFTIWRCTNFAGRALAWK